MTDFLEYCNEQMSIVDTQAKLAQLPEILSENNHTMALTRHGRPVLALLPWELFQSIVETMEIMSDPELMESIRHGIKDVEEGNLVPIEQVKAELGID
jgi:PHD/YefM family antitoxin component YafN of YafNO toxin-antitoxin module